MKTREPRWINGIPLCTTDDCPIYDGKRCTELGFRPSSICDPQVSEMANALRLIRTFDEKTNRIDVAKIAANALETK